MRAVSFRWMPVTLLALVLWSMTGICVLGQDLERIAPKSLQTPAAPAQIQEPPPPESAVSEPDRLLLKQLRGMTFLHDPNKVSREGIPFDGIRSDERMPESFYQEMRSFLNQPLTMGRLSEILKKVVLYYRSQSKPVVDAYFPEQDITGGNVQILIIVGRVGAVRVEGNRWFSSEDIEAQMSLRPGEPILGKVLAEDVNWLNRNPFRHVDLVLARGEKRGRSCSSGESSPVIARSAKRSSSTSTSSTRSALPMATSSACPRRGRARSSAIRWVRTVACDPVSMRKR